MSTTHPRVSAALPGDRSHGHWQIAPAESARRVTPRCRRHSLVLETEFVTSSGAVRIVDCMPPPQEDAESSGSWRGSPAKCR